MKIIIDGYNLLFAERRLPQNPNSLERARNELIWHLSSYNLKKNYQIIVVFDGGKSASYWSFRRTIPVPTGGKLTIFFSAPEETADDLIRELVQHEYENTPSKNLRQNMRVVTSDQALSKLLVKHGAPIISVESFLKELEQSFYQPNGEDSAHPEPIEKTTGLRPNEVDRWLDVFGLK